MLGPMLKMLPKPIGDIANFFMSLPRIEGLERLRAMDAKPKVPDNLDVNRPLWDIILSAIRPECIILNSVMPEILKSKRVFKSVAIILRPKTVYSEGYGLSYVELAVNAITRIADRFRTLDEDFRLLRGDRDEG